MLENYHRLNATISDLIMGNTYKFRVFAENKCGISEDAAVTKEEAKILKEGTLLALLFFYQDMEDLLQCLRIISLSYSNVTVTL